MADKKPMDHKGFAALLLATPKKPGMSDKPMDAPESAETDPDADEAPEVACAKELCDAVHAKDYKGVAEAIEACVRLATSKGAMAEEKGEPAEAMDQPGAGQ